MRISSLKIKEFFVALTMILIATPALADENIISSVVISKSKDNSNSYELSIDSTQQVPYRSHIDNDGNVYFDLKNSTLAKNLGTIYNDVSNIDNVTVKQLDKNRAKKDCKYALLVSQLELDQTNRTPIYKVNEYKDMYVCEPAYLMTFLNMIVSLTMRFKDLVLDNENERLALKDINEILADFEKIKTTYLDNPLESLKKKVENIKTEARKIEDAANKINEYVNKITTDYINEIANKIERFNIKRIIKKVSKID